MKFKLCILRSFTFFMIAFSCILNASESLDYPNQQRIDNINNFLNRNIPGLNVSYNEVIDTLIHHGWDIYIRGGAMRDLLAPIPVEPNDIDFDYSGTVEELRSILEENHWQYTQLPGRSTIIIGDHRGIHMEAVPLSIAFGHGESSLEFTINNIFYHCNKKCFVSGAETGFEDLAYKRLHILTPNWKAWLYRKGRHPYERIFRSWNMIGKGFIYSADFANFLNREVLKKIDKFPDIFHEEMLHYVAGHFESFDDVYHGAVAIMGYNWARDNLLSMKSEARQKSIEEERLKDQFTHFRTQIQYTECDSKFGF